MSNLPKIKYTEDFRYLLSLIKDDSYVAHELINMLDTDYYNGLKIVEVDVSDSDWCFNVTLEDGTETPMKIGKFIRYYFKDRISNNELTKFAKSYNDIVKMQDEEDYGDYIEPTEFKFNPKDPRSTFLSLVTKTYPHGHEDEVLNFLPKLNKDQIGNYYKIIGSSPKTMFTCHLDTADRKQMDTTLFSVFENGEEFIVTDGKTILGADDKSGVTVMLYMMEHNIPGLYYFFIGEERGGIGSHALADIYDKVDYLKEIDKCISFDRRNYHSVITKQMGLDCCSNQFATALCNEYNKNGLDLSLDPTGIYTDSASFIDNIPECTNISVGYFNEHTGSEHQNMTFLKLLCEASVKVKWESLPISRKFASVTTLTSENKSFVEKLNSLTNLETKLVIEDSKTYYRISLDDAEIEDIHHDLMNISIELKSLGKDPDIIIDDFYLKIELT
jgi:hypothetical protein